MQANSTQNITLMKNGVITPFQLNNALFSSGDVFSLINGAIKVSEGGLYEISAGVYFENDVAASPFNGVYIKSNGNEIASTVITTRAGGGIGLASKVVSLTAGAEVTLNARHIGGSNVTAEGNNPATYLYIKYLGKDNV